LPEEGRRLTRRLEELRNQVADLCSRTEVPEPGEFLASLMSGVDPRKRDPLLRSLVLAAVREAGGDRSVPPSPEDWSDIADLVLDSGMYDSEPVPLETSYQAATKLMEYLHAKLKSVEVSADVNLSAAVVPLTDEEIERFKRIWDSRF
jgi:hypothetical protein